eukprot:TRINITY_DN7976_c1_g1_i2.p1 TRINITY_DN7976_c1_g1~~TRINITY_DN7976_c1_g1_i2.p1  ORF type:complete len:696 (-),score=93.11 TRINITY_DN7976_c1_g1_i2:160-2205(-)
MDTSNGDNKFDSNTLLETVEIKDEQFPFPAIYVNNQDKKTAVKREKLERLNHVESVISDPSTYSNQCHLLKDILEEAKLTLEKAHECAVEISQSQIFTSLEYFAEVTSSIDQANISTTVGLTALESILSTRKYESGHETGIKEELIEADNSDIEDNEFNGKVQVVTPEPPEEFDDADSTFFPKLKKPKSDKSGPLPKKFKCVECSYVAARPTEMKTHLRSEHGRTEDSTLVCENGNTGVKVYMCTHCSYSKGRQETVESHIALKHKTSEASNEEEGEELRCPKCCYATKNKTYFDDHVSGENNYFKCLWCDEHFSKKVKYRFAQHVRTEHGLCEKDEKGFVSYKCPVCGVKIPVIRKFLIHVKDVHKIGPMFHCMKCDYSGISQHNLNFHMEGHEEAKFFCTQCPHQARSHFRLTKHINNCHGQGKICDKCGCVYRSNESLIQHKLRCNDKARKSRMFYGNRQRRREIEVTCSQCGDFTTKSIEKLKYHYAEAHKVAGSDKEIDQKCSLCNHVSTTIQNLRNHFYKEHESKSIKCDECDYETSWKSALILHKEQKHMPAKYPCDMCDLAFKTKKTLERHVNVKHATNPTKYSCQEEGCEYTALNREYVKRHVEKVHLGIRYPCNLCDYTGPYKGELNRHMKKVHNVIPEGCVMKCELCDFTSKWTATLAAHKKKVHNVESC